MAERLEESVLTKIRGDVLVIDRDRYHLVRNEATRPAASKLRKAEFADWLEKHDPAVTEWGSEWRTTCTPAVLKKRADENRPRPRYLVQDLAVRFGVSILIFPVSHPELNPIEMIWGTVTMALKRANLAFSLAPLRGLAEAEFEKTAAEMWVRYEDHTIMVETYYRGVDEVCSDIESTFNGDRDDNEVEGSALGAASDTEHDAMSD